jgi:Carboxypeptidase regulatory-like domain/Tetratricopeptide repeat
LFAPGGAIIFQHHSAGASREASMRKLSIFVITTLFVALLVPAAIAQTGSIKGSIVDENKKPIAGAKIDMVSKETGRKYELKSDKNGQIFSLGIAAGNYDVTVTSSTGQLLTKYTSFPVKLDENRLDIDMAKEHAQAQQSISPEQKAQQEAVNKENVKIKGLNEKLAAAKAASDAGNFDQAVQILTEATQMDPNRDLLWLKLGDAQRSAAQKATDPAAKKTGY